MKKDIIAIQKFARISPKKARKLVREVKKLNPAASLEVLALVNLKAAEMLAKVVKTAIANAKVQGFSEDTLYFKEIQINQGPSYKRGRAVSRGRHHPYKKRLSHIRVVLGVKESISRKVNETLKSEESQSEKEKKTKKTEKAGKKVNLKKA